MVRMTIKIKLEKKLSILQKKKPKIRLDIDECDDYVNGFCVYVRFARASEYVNTVCSNIINL